MSVRLDFRRMSYLQQWTGSFQQQTTLGRESCPRSVGVTIPLKKLRHCRHFSALVDYFPGVEIRAVPLSGIDVSKVVLSSQRSFSRCRPWLPIELTMKGLDIALYNKHTSKMGAVDHLVFVKILVLAVMFLALLYLDDTFFSSGFERAMKSVGRTVISTRNISSLYKVKETAHFRRRLLLSNRRLLLVELCSKSDISIVQGEGNPLPSGIPTFSVQIMNLCPVGCAVTDIHVACGWFASAKLINPQLFRRLTFNDCLVNDGNPLDGGDSVSFEYSNSFEYPMRIEAAAVCRSP